MDNQQSPEPKQTRPYSYISIRGDQYHDATQPIAKVHQLLKTRGELRDNGDRTYSNAPGFPWLCLALLNCDPMGNYPAGLPRTAPRSICSNSSTSMTATSSKRNFALTSPATLPQP